MNDELNELREQWIREYYMKRTHNGVNIPRAAVMYLTEIEYQSMTKALDESNLNEFLGYIEWAYARKEKGW